jgi:hypothetical protein
VIRHHFLGERLGIGICLFRQGELARLNFEHVADRDFVDEFLRGGGSGLGERERGQQPAGRCETQGCFHDECSHLHGRPEAAQRRNIGRLRMFRGVTAPIAGGRSTWHSQGRKPDGAMNLVSGGNWRLGISLLMARLPLAMACPISSL